MQFLLPAVVVYKVTRLWSYCRNGLEVSCLGRNILSSMLSTLVGLANSAVRYESVANFIASDKNFE